MVLDDMFVGLGKNDQKVYVVLLEDLVVVCFGNDVGEGLLVFFDFDGLFWEKISVFVCIMSVEELFVME